MFLMMLLTIAALAIPLGLLAIGWLSLHRDLFFFAVFLEIIAYLHVAPMFASAQLDAQMQTLYVWIQLSTLVVFDIPFALIYCLRMGVWEARRRAEGASPRPEVAVSSGRRTLFAAVMIFLPIVFGITALGSAIFFRRVGHEALAERSADLPLAAFAFYRMYPETALLLISVLVVAHLRSRPGAGRRVAFAVLAFNVIVYGLYVLANSRLQSVLMLVFLYGLVTYTRRPGDAPIRIPVRATVLLVLTALYLVRVVVNVRQTLTVLRTPITAAVLNPLGVGGEPEGTPLQWRLNCVDLMARITPRAWEQGYAMGRAWAEPVALLQQLYDREAVRQAKLEFRTHAKGWLQREYVDEHTADYYSCQLTDTYGNFGVFGFLLTAVVLAHLLAFGTRWIQWPTSELTFLLGVVFIVQVLAFEKEFASIPLNWLKFYGPMLVFLSVLRPIRLRLSAGGAGGAGGGKMAPDLRGEGVGGGVRP